MTVLSMSRAEIDRVHVLKDLLAERIRPSEAAQLMGVTRRRAFRLLKAYHAGGPAALISKKRGSRAIGVAPHKPGLVRPVVATVILVKGRPVGPTVDEAITSRADTAVAGRELNHIGGVRLGVVVGS